MECPTEPEQQQQPFDEQQQQQERQPQPPEREPADREEPSAAAGAAGSPGSVLGRLRTRFRQSSEDLLTAKEQNIELEKRITSLTEQILAANEEKEALKAEHRASLSRLEEAALSERRRYENALCSARQQQQRGQMDLQLATDELTALRGQLKTLQMEKVSLARQVRDLETEVKARCRLQQNTSDQMVRYNQAKNKLNKEVAGLVDWLRRLESESAAAAALNRRLQLLLQHQSLQLEQLAPAAATPAGSDTTCPELEQLRQLLAATGDREGGAGDGQVQPPPPPAAPPASHDPTETKPLPSGPPLKSFHTETASEDHKPAEGGDVTEPQDVNWSEDGFTGSETVTPLLLTVPRLDSGAGNV